MGTYSWGRRISVRLAVSLGLEFQGLILGSVTVYIGFTWGVYAHARLRACLKSGCLGQTLAVKWRKGSTVPGSGVQYVETLHGGLSPNPKLQSF